MVVVGEGIVYHTGAQHLPRLRFGLIWAVDIGLKNRAELILKDE
jgi:hypothetical protein